MATSVLRMIPSHNSIAYPEYWYDMAFFIIVVLSIASAHAYITEVYFYLKLESLAFIPLCGGFDPWIRSKVVAKVTKNETAEKVYSISIFLEFTVYVAIILVSENDSTVYFYLIVELSLHLISCYKIIKNEKKNINNFEKYMIAERRQIIEEVVLSESIKALVPLAYAASSATSYYGPNAIMIGNVRVQ